MTSQGEAYLEPDLSPVEPETFTGHVDTVGLTALGWDSYDIAWLQAHVWWDEEDDNKWKVSEANLAFGPNGSTPLVWADRAAQKNNPDIVFFPKFTLAPTSNTSWGSLMSDWRYVCAIPTHGWDTTNVTSFNSLFNNCYNIRSVGDLSGWNVAKVTGFSSTFSHCDSLRDVGNLNNWNTSKVTTFYYTFYFCLSLENIGDVSNWNTSSCTSFTNMFYCCGSLRHIGDLSSWDTSKTTSLTQMFYQCNLITSLGDLSGWNTSKVTNMSGVFYYCHRLTYIGDISEWDVSNVTTFGSMFNQCFFLSSVGSLSGWNTSKATTMISMFYQCRNLESLDLTNWDVSSLTGTGLQNMFTACYVLRTVGDLSNWEVTSNITSLYQMFQLCRQLRKIGDISNWDTSNVTSLGYIFEGCRVLDNVNVSKWNTAKVSNFLSAFSTNIYLDKIDISGWDTTSCTSAAYISSNASNAVMNSCYKTKTVVLGSKFFNSSVSTFHFDRARSWTRDSVVESLYTNQTLRNSSSPAKTVRLWSGVYDSLTQEDISNISSKNITLVRSTAA